MRPPARVLPLLSAVVALGALGAWYARSPQADAPVSVEGMVRTTEIKISPEVSGRLARVLVTPGQHVNKGDVVALLSSPELFAAVGEARAQADLAAVARDRVYAGVRDEQVESLRREVLKAQAAQTLAHQELGRIATLALRSDASLQQRDAARNESARADADVRVAQARYAEAQLGPTSEERALADAQVHTAEAARDVIEARAAKMLLRAPATGEIGLVVPEIGEDVIPGEPVLTLIPEGGAWFGFDVREDALDGVAIGTQVPVAAQGEVATGHLTEMRNRGEFATWRAARASGDHDLNTFFLRVDPAQPSRSLVPGETVWLQLPSHK